jgi:hypothetical protein
MANLILPNGQTIQTDNPAEIAEFMARGAQDQSAAVAASPGQTIQQIASERGQAWNRQGGQGYLDAMRGGFNDPTSDPRNPQAFSAAAIMNQNNNGLPPGRRRPSRWRGKRERIRWRWRWRWWQLRQRRLDLRRVYARKSDHRGACIITVNDGSEIVRGHPEQVQPIQHL